LPLPLAVANEPIEMFPAWEAVDCWPIATLWSALAVATPSATLPPPAALALTPIAVA
jgi:hypothetical protein